MCALILLLRGYRCPMDGRCFNERSGDQCPVCGQPGDKVWIVKFPGDVEGNVESRIVILPAAPRRRIDGGWDRGQQETPSTTSRFRSLVP
jgi:hypothetical protein